MRGGKHLALHFELVEKELMRLKSMPPAEMTEVEFRRLESLLSQIPYRYIRLETFKHKKKDIDESIQQLKKLADVPLYV